MPSAHVAVERDKLRIGVDIQSLGKCLLKTLLFGYRSQIRVISVPDSTRSTRRKDFERQRAQPGHQAPQGIVGRKTSHLGERCATVGWGTKPALVAASTSSTSTYRVTNENLNLFA